MRQVVLFDKVENLSTKMRNKFDTAYGRTMYTKRPGVWISYTAYTILRISLTVLNYFLFQIQNNINPPAEDRRKYYRKYNWKESNDIYFLDQDI